MNHFIPQALSLVWPCALSLLIIQLSLAWLPHAHTYYRHTYTHTHTLKGNTEKTVIATVIMLWSERVSRFAFSHQKWLGE